MQVLGLGILEIHQYEVRLQAVVLIRYPIARVREEFVLILATIGL